MHYLKGKVKMDIVGANLMEFEKYLRVNNLVPVDKIKYYSNWTDKFLHSISYKTTDINQNAIICFINSMRKNPKYEEWQVRQAEDSVRMYIRNFMNLNTRPAVQNKTRKWVI